MPAWAVRALQVALVAAICAAVVFGIVHGYELWRSSVREDGLTAGRAEIQARWDADVRKRDAQKLLDIKADREDELEKQRLVNQGERNAKQRHEQRAAADRAAADRSAAAAGGLRDSIDALDRAARDLNLADAASCPGELGRQRDAAVRARHMLRACSEEYRGLAGAVDSAWTALSLKFDTALSYIHAVKP